MQPLNDKVLFVARRQRKKERNIRLANEAVARSETLSKYLLLANTGGIGIVATILGTSALTNPDEKLPVLMVCVLTAYVIGAAMSLNEFANRFLYVVALLNLGSRSQIKPAVEKSTSFYATLLSESVHLFQRSIGFNFNLSLWFFLGATFASLVWVWSQVII